jgi:hypothetical protein
MASSGCSGPIFLVLSPGVVGRDTGSTLAALVPVIYDARARAVVIDSMEHGLRAVPAADTDSSACPPILAPPTDGTFV